MTPALQAKILEALEAKPNQKANELADQVGCTRTEINRILYGPLKSRVSQDRNYRWSLAAPGSDLSGHEDSEPAAQFEKTDLARLCQYYLACLGYVDTGVSTFLTSKYGDPDYLEVHAIPRSPDDLAENDRARRLLGRKRTERGRYGLYFGYPTHILFLQSRTSNWRGFMVEPILLFPMEQEPDSGRLTVDLSFPIINQKPFQNFTNVERDMLMNDLVQLEQELGLGGDEGSPEIDEIAMRLQAIRPEWPWKEEVDPTGLEVERIPIAEIDVAGIYNRAVVLMAEKSPYTRGLEKELRDLARIPIQRYASTALGQWLSDDISSSELTEEATQPLIEVLPMNSEQRQAVSAALNQPITVITGPPGTGKSQVVTNLLINAAWSGKRVLFASKNNKAVDVVETRINALGSRPILLRVGAKAYQVRLAEYVLSLLSATTTVGEKEEFADAKSVHERLVTEHSRLSRDMRRLIELRNDIDKLEQLAEEARERLGPKLFARALDLDVNIVESSLNSVSSALDNADRNRVGVFAKIFWPLFRNGRIADLATKLREAQAIFAAVKVVPPAAPTQDADVSIVREVVQKVSSILGDLKKAIAYRKALHDLQALRPMEDIAREDARLLHRIARHSEILWKLWLRLQPSMLSAKERRNLGKYTSLLKMVIEAGDDGELSRQVYGQYTAMLREISHLLPCWAVTSLSARGRIPFEPGNFDLVVFDEASQCDIASALPLLYRAKSVVVIGDPNQLSHISGLQRGQDQALLERYDLMEDFPHWAYSHQSLFALGSTRVAGESIVSLVDHHRSHADIISFSNDEFYEERLRIATNYDSLRSPNRSEPGVRWVDVNGKAARPGTGGAINTIEANTVVATLRDLVVNKGYGGSVGVVTPFRAQANAITELVNRDDQLASLLMQRGFLADTVHKFQGDERDVMIFSPVVSIGFPQGALGFLRSNGNLFNVAITRARAQLIVVGDRTACGYCDVGYLSRFAKYAASLEDQLREDVDTQIEEYGPTYPNVAKPELVSDWERQFYVAAYQAGFRLIPQYHIEKYIVDFLMVEGERKLVIEIDGERYHRNWTGELCRRDQIRNQRLFELGYDVIRFWVYEVRDDLDGCLKRLKLWHSNELNVDIRPLRIECGSSR